MAAVVHYAGRKRATTLNKRGGRGSRGQPLLPSQTAKTNRTPSS